MSVSNPDHLKAEIDELVPDLVAMRRDLHEHPELAFQETRTSGIVAERLKALGMEVQTGVAKTGVVGLLRGKTEGKTLAIRADMDALPIHELNALDYRSQTDGKMHACGHDGHTSILLAVADMLSKRQAELKGNIKFVFQPAEEDIGGARPMVEQGAMQGVDGVIGLHLFSTLPVGLVGVRAGTTFASADKFTLTVYGQGGHAAMFERAIDPIAISAYIITALQTLTSRETSPLTPAVITIGSIQAGTAFNIIPETATLEGTMRAYSNEHREFLMRRIGELSAGIAASMGGSCEMERHDVNCPPCVNDPDMAALVHKAATATVGAENVTDDILTTGSDDMSYFLDAVPGCYFIVGARNPAKGAEYAHHNARFNIDEDALPTAVEVLTRSALDFLEA
jgi:amidohydrolase